MSIFLACCLLLSINFETVFASDIETNTNADIMSLDGPSTTFDGRLLEELVEFLPYIRFIFVGKVLMRFKR